MHVVWFYLTYRGGNNGAAETEEETWPTVIRAGKWARQGQIWKGSKMRREGTGEKRIIKKVELRNTQDDRERNGVEMCLRKREK